MRRVVAAIAACACLAASCGRAHDAAPAVSAAPAATPAAPGSVPHGDHNPHHGGIVLMNGDLHFEVVLGKDGARRVYFSDAVRAELPAATVAGVTVTTTEKGRPPDTVALHIDEDGESWIGRGPPVDAPAASARIAFTAQGKPYFIDVPFPH